MGPIDDIGVGDELEINGGDEGDRSISSVEDSNEYFFVFVFQKKETKIKQQ